MSFHFYNDNDCVIECACLLQLDIFVLYAINVNI